MNNYKTLTIKSFFLIFIILIVFPVISEAESSSPVEKTDSPSSSSSNSLKYKPADNVALESYRKLLRIKLITIKEALESIMQKYNNFEKQYKIVGIIVEKILKFFSDAKVKLTELGVAPGDPFPTDEKIKEIYSLVIENTYFLGKLTLKLPDIIHELMSSHPEWKSYVQFAIGFTNDSNAFQGIDDKLLNLMSQELNIIERSPDYVNRNSRKYIEENSKLKEKEMKEIRKAKSKEKKKKVKGPKLSGPRHSEL